MFKDELKQLLARAITDLNAGHGVLALSAMHDVFNRVERAIAADADGKTELGRVVRENASLRITLHQQAEAIAAQRKVIADKNETVGLLQAENGGLDSDLRKCQAELQDKTNECQAAIRIGNEALAELKKCRQDNDALRAGNETIRKQAAEVQWSVDRWVDDRRPGDDRVDHLRRVFEKTWCDHSHRLETLEKRVAQLNHL